MLNPLKWGVVEGKRHIWLAVIDVLLLIAFIYLIWLFIELKSVYTPSVENCYDFCIKEVCPQTFGKIT